MPFRYPLCCSRPVVSREGSRRHDHLRRMRGQPLGAEQALGAPGDGGVSRSGDHDPGLGTLSEAADALGYRLEVRFKKRRKAGRWPRLRENFVRLVEAHHALSSPRCATVWVKVASETPIRGLYHLGYGEVAIEVFGDSTSWYGSPSPRGQGRGRLARRGRCAGWRCDLGVAPQVQTLGAGQPDQCCNKAPPGRIHMLRKQDADSGGGGSPR